MSIYSNFMLNVLVLKKKNFRFYVYYIHNTHEAYALISLYRYKHLNMTIVPNFYYGFLCIQVLITCMFIVWICNDNNSTVIVMGGFLDMDILFKVYDTNNSRIAINIACLSHQKETIKHTEIVATHNIQWRTKLRAINLQSLNFSLLFCLN